MTENEGDNMEEMANYWKKKALQNWNKKVANIFDLLFLIPHRQQEFWNVLSTKAIFLYRTTITYACITLTYP